MLDGKSVEIVFVTNAGVSAALPLSPTAQNLQGLGFRQLNKSAITATADGALPVPDPTALNSIATDVRIVARTIDAQARIRHAPQRPVSRVRGLQQ